RRARATTRPARSEGGSRSALRLGGAAAVAQALLHGGHALFRPVTQRGVGALGGDRFVGDQGGAPLALLLPRQTKPGQRTIPDRRIRGLHVSRRLEGFGRGREALELQLGFAGEQE